MTTPEACIAEALAKHRWMEDPYSAGECSCGYRDDADDVGHQAAVIAALPDIAIVRRTLLAELVDPDPCWFDHNGGCQAHGYISLEPGETCPVHDAKAILAAGGES